MIARILPGTSVETAAGARSTALGVSGVVAMPLALGWGDTVTVIRPGQDTLTMLGYKLSHPAVKLVNEVMRSANQLILYRLNTGEKATASLTEGLTATALYSGTRGNDLSVTVAAVGGGWSIKTYLETAEVDVQTVVTSGDFRPNGWIALEGAGALAAGTATLVGGTDGEVAEGAWHGFTIELERQAYNIIAYTGEEQAVALELIGFVNLQRANDINVQLVQSVVDANNIAVYKNTVGGYTAAYKLTAAEACATMAGLLAKQGIDGSATYLDVPWWYDVTPRLTRRQQEQRIQNGEILCVLLHGGVKVLYDINSRTSVTEETPEDFKKGLVIRTLDSLNTDLKILLDTRAVGKLRNSVAGRNQIKGYIVDMVKAKYLGNGYIEGFTADDVAVLPAEARDTITATVGVQVADTVDKIYVTVTAL